MENNQFNKSLCEEIFGGELDDTEESEIEKSQARQYKNTLREMAAKEGIMILRITKIFEKMEDFCRSKKNKSHSIRIYLWPENTLQLRQSLLHWN